MKTALIFGICGQDAAYLSQLLLDKGYRVVGVGRTINDEKIWRLREFALTNAIELRSGDIMDAGSVCALFQELKPDECYNFAAISFVGQSWTIPAVTHEINATGVVNILNAIRVFSPHTKVYQPGSSEMFGKPSVSPQTELMAFAPCNPYGISKLSAYHTSRVYREAYGLFVGNAICYNHESPLRGIEYVTRKITNSVARIAGGTLNTLRLGNTDARRDWGFAGDYVFAMWMMLQQEKPDDYILSTGTTHSIKEFLDVAFHAVEISDWSDLVIEDPAFYRPLEPELLCGDNTKAKTVLGWSPSMTFDELVASMVCADQNRVS